MRPDLSEFHQAAETVELRAALIASQRQLRAARAKNEQLVEATFDGAKAALLALGPVELVPAPARDRRRGKPEVAVWHLTDWQGGKVTTSYNSRVMRERVMRFCDKADRLTEIQRAHHPVQDCTILLGGDLLEGLFQFPGQPFEIDSTLFEQVMTVSRLVADVVRRALATYRNVEVVCEWGNHGRIGHKRAAVPLHDNLDRMVHALAAETLRAETRVTWRMSEEDIQRVEIGAYRALLIHGDEIGRSGHASPMTIVRHCAQWQSGAYPWEFTDVYTAHRHTHAEWPLPNGRGAVYQTGSPESDNRYAGVLMGSSAHPSQRLHFVDPAKGRVTAQYRVALDA